MSSGVLYELRSTAARPFVLALAALLVVVGAAALLTVPSPDRPPGLASTFYFENGELVLSVLAYGPDGAPLVHRTVTFASPQGLPAGSTTSAVTDGDGIARATIPNDGYNATYSATVTGPSGATTITTQVANWPNPVPPGTPLAGYGDLVPVRLGAYRAVGALLVFATGPGGSAPSGYRLQYQFATFDANEAPSAAPRPEGANATFVVGPLASFSEVFPLRPPAPPPGFGPALVVRLVAPDGAVRADAIFPAAAFGPSSDPTPAASAAGLALSELGVATLVLGLVGGFSGYASDRVSGALDPFLARRIGPGGLLAARYLGVLGPLVAGAVLSVVAVDLGLFLRFGAWAPPGLVEVGAASLSAGAAAFLAIPFLLAHLARTPVALMTGLVAVLVVLGFLWIPTMVVLGPVLGAPPGTVAAATVAFDGGLVNPALAPATLVPAALGGTDPETIAGAVTVAVLWIALPLGVAFRRARSAD